MLRMDQVHVIRHKVLVEEQSIRKVAREMKVSRNTVRKYLKVSQAIRQESGPRPRPVWEQVGPRIDELLAEWKHRTTAKQRITGTRLHRQLVEEGYRVGVTTVRTYLGEKRRREAEVFVPLVWRAGDAAQVDFFEVTVQVAGQRCKVWKFVLRLMYSGRDFVWLYERADQLAFLDGHVRAFEQLGGIPSRIIYDNLSAAVRRRVGAERELTDRFRALASHYLFEPCFTRIGEGHDKGGVEARGKGLRLEHLTPIPEGETLNEISHRLLEELKQSNQRRRLSSGETVAQRFERERESLRSLPQDRFEARRLELVRVNRRGMIRIEGTDYSVPSRWNQLEVEAWVGVEDLRLVCRGQTQVLARQSRGSRAIQYRHYLEELAVKPQAVRQVAPELIAELGQPYGRFWELLCQAHGARKAARLLASVLAAVAKLGEETVRQALDQVLEAGECDLVKLHERLYPRRPATVPIPEKLRGYPVETARASDYNWLLNPGGVR